LSYAAESFDISAMKEILGPGSEDIVASEDQVQDKNRAAEFVAKAHEKKSIKSTRLIRNVRLCPSVRTIGPGDGTLRPRQDLTGDE
ncbi:MAG TPA: DUF2950 family protein, partial [Chthoniobacterales bacterium]